MTSGASDCSCPAMILGSRQSSRAPRAWACWKRGTTSSHSKVLRSSPRHMSTAFAAAPAASSSVLPAYKISVLDQQLSYGCIPECICYLRATRVPQDEHSPNEHKEHPLKTGRLPSAYRLSLFPSIRASQKARGWAELTWQPGIQVPKHETPEGVLNRLWICPAPS